MRDQPEDLMPVMLRAIRGDIGEIKADMREVKERLERFQPCRNRASGTGAICDS
jgi:hypothetical protein